MNNDKVEGLLAEIVQQTGFVNIDQKDIDAFRQSVDGGGRGKGSWQG